MPANLQFDIRPGTAARARRTDDQAPMRMLLLGDFGGHARRDLLASRCPLRVDIDNVDAVMRRIAPRLMLEIGGTAVDLDLSSLDAFHPDHLCRSVSPLRTLRETRERLHSGALPAAAAAAEDPAALLGRLLGRVPQTTGAAPPADPMQAWIHGLVAPHIVPALPVDQQALERVDDSLAEPLKALLHAPVFSALEVAWRGVHWLVNRLDLNEGLQLYLLDATREELQADLAGAQGDLSDSALSRLLGEGSDEAEGPRWSLLVGLLAFGPTADDLALLAGLGAVAAQAGGPFIAAAEPALFGCGAVADLPEPRSWLSLAGDAAQHWPALRHSTLAPWIGLVAPRLLMRLPYGKATDPTEGFAFEEQPPAPLHDTLAWGPGSLAVALLLGQTFTEHGWGFSPGQGQDVHDLPAYTFPLDGQTQLQPCAEAWLGERAGQALLEHGVMPLLSHRQRASVRLARVVSIAEPAQPLAGPWG